MGSWSGGGVIGEIRTGGSFRGLTHYLLHGSAATRAKTPEWVELRNLASRDAERAWVEMEATASENPRVGKPVFHVVLSPAPGDELGDGDWKRLADRVLGELGLGEHQVLVALHRDTDHPHLHLAVNRVHPVTGKAWSAWRSKTRLEGILRGVERDWGLRVVPGRLAGAERDEVDRRSAPPLSVGEQAVVRQRASEPQVVAWRRELSGAFREAESWSDLAARLQVNGVHLVARGRGLVVSDGEVLVKASRLDRDFSRGRLEARFGQTFGEWRKDRKAFEAAAEVYPKYVARGPDDPRARAALGTLRRTGRSLGWGAVRRLSGPLAPSVAGVGLSARRRARVEARLGARERAEDWGRFARRYLRPALERAGSWAEVESRLRLYGAWVARGDGGRLVVTDGYHRTAVGRLEPEVGFRRLEKRLGSFREWERSRRELMAAARRVAAGEGREADAARWRRLSGVIEASERRVERYEGLYEEYRRVEGRLRGLLGGRDGQGRRAVRGVEEALDRLRSVPDGELERTVRSVVRRGRAGRSLRRRDRFERGLEEARRYRGLARELRRSAAPARSAARRLVRLREQAWLRSPQRVRREGRRVLVAMARPLLGAGVRSLLAGAAPGLGPALTVVRVLRGVHRDLRRATEREGGRGR